MNHLRSITFIQTWHETYQNAKKKNSKGRVHCFAALLIDNIKSKKPKLGIDGGQSVFQYESKYKGINTIDQWTIRTDIFFLYHINVYI